MQICTGIVACAYNFLTIFSLSFLYLTLSSFSLSLSLSAHNSFFLPLIWSIFLPLINLSSSSFRRSPSLSPPPPLIALSSFVSRHFRVEWAWSVGFGLNVSRHRHCLPLEASILFLVLAIATGGVDSGWVVWIVLLGLFRFRVAGLCCWVVLIPCASILLLGLFFWYSAGGLCGLCCWVCSISGCWIVWIVLLGCVDFGCVDLVAGFVFLVFCRWVVWIPVWYRCGLWVWVGGCVGKEMNILFE